MEEKSKRIKTGFFKTIWYSIFKLERYGELAAEGVPRALGYVVKLTIIMSIIISLAMLFKTNLTLNKAVTFLETQVGDFSYKDGNLQLAEEKVVRAPSSIAGEIIINTNANTDEDINKYLNSLNSNKAIILTKDKFLIKGVSASGVLTYSYSQITEGMDIKELNKEQVLNYITGNNSIKLYVFIFLIGIGYFLINLLISMLTNIFILSLFGCMVAWLAKIKMRYAAIFNLAVYSFTLSSILYTIYIILGIFTDITVKYFQVMYISVSAIYIIASILLIKSDFIKKQIEIAKIKKTENENQKEKKTDIDNEEKDNNTDSDNTEKDDKNGNEDKKEGKKGNSSDGEPELS